MEASFVEDHCVSKPSCSLIQLRSSEAVVADDKQMADKCEHFTIRGYVADVRKKDLKICWPFSALSNYSQSEDAMLLPPLSVTKFKRWGCQTCWGTTVASASVIENGGDVYTLNYERESDNFLLLHNSPTASHQNATTTFSGLAQPYEENALEGRSNNTNSSVDVRNSEYLSTLHCGNADSESHLASQLMKEGLQIYRDKHNISDENQKQPNASNYIAVEGDKFGTEEKAERNTALSAKAYETSLCEDAPVSAKENEVKSICAVTSSQMCGNPTSKSTNVASFGLEADQLVSRKDKMMKPSDILSEGSGMHVAALMSDHDSINLEDHHEAFEINLVTVNKMARKQKNDNQLEKLSEKMKHKKVRKVRLLNDIMRSDQLHLPGEAEPNNNVADKMESTSKVEAQNPERGRQFVDWKSEVNHTEKKNRSDVIPNDDVHYFLMQCLKKTPSKRVVTLDGYVETQTDDFSIRLDTDTSSRKDPGHKTEVHKVRQRKREVIFGRKKNMMPQMKALRPQLSLQMDSITVKGNTSKSVLNDGMQKKYIHSSKNIIINEKILHHGLKIQDNTHQKDISSNKKRKAHQVIEEQFYQLPFVKGKVTKKQGTMRTWDKGVVDDIPMDIVELLANNLHENRPKNTECATKSLDYLSQVTKNLKEGGVTGVAKCHRNEGSKAIYDKVIQQKSQVDTRNGLLATGMSHVNAFGQLKTYCYSTICDQGRDSSTRFQEFSPSNIFPTSREDIHVAFKYENSFPQKCCLDRSNVMGQFASDRTFGKVHDASRVLLIGETSGINCPKINPNLNRVNMDSSNIYLKKDQRNSFQKTTLQRSLKAPAKQPLACKWKGESSIEPGFPTAATPVLVVDNVCHSVATWPADQHTSGNISALNFTTVWSAGDFHTSLNTNHAGLIQESELLRSGVGFKSIETVEHQRNSCKPVRPIPRIGILGNSLQKEIANLSGNFRPRSGIEVGCSTQMMSPIINAISRSEYSKWIVPNLVSTSHAECSQKSNGIQEVDFRNKDVSVQSPSSSFGMEICVVNRNPAEFTLPGEDNMYMRGKEGPRPECLPTSKNQKHCTNREKPKQQKVKKLSALKLLIKG